MYITEDSIEIVFTTVLFELLNEELFVKDLLERADYWMVALTLSFVCFDRGPKTLISRSYFYRFEAFG